MKSLIVVLIFFLNPVLTAIGQTGGNNKVIIAGQIRNATMETIELPLLNP